MEISQYLIMRAASAFMACSLMAQSGSLTQFVSHNGLATPSTLGIASFPLLTLLLCTIGQQLFFSSATTYYEFWPLLFVFYLVFAPLGLFFFQRAFRQYPILMGLGLNLSVIGLFQLVQFLFIADNRPFPYDLYMGSFKQTNEARFLFLLAIFLLAQGWLWRLQKRLKLFLLGHEFALGLGKDISRVQREVLIFTLLVAGAIAFPFGLLNFLDLTIPHLVRFLFPRMRTLSFELFAGTFLASLAVSLLDILCYYFPWRGAELSLGLVFSCLGPLILVYLISTKIDEKK